MTTHTREDARRRDAEDPLAAFADRFDVPADCYMDGNSLGPASEEAVAAVERALRQWREQGIEAWTEAEPDWWHYGEDLGDRLAPLVGADGPEVCVANSTTVNVHSLLGTFVEKADQPGILVNDLDFPTDHYAIRAQLRARGHDPDAHLHRVESRDGRTIDHAAVERVLAEEDIGVLFFPSVLYRSGQLFDVERLTRAAHEHDAYAGFDVAHSIGVVPHEFDAAGVDFAVWCHYKYVNAGPGAVAGLYLAEEHFGSTPGLPGWWGHEKETMFDMQPTYTPAQSAGAYQIGTVTVLSAAPLYGALEVIHEAGIRRIRDKSVALTEYLIDLADDRLAPLDYEVGTPRDPEGRGGHVALEHAAGVRVSEALRDRGVVVDFRPPNVVRVAPSPLYTSFEAVYDTVEHLRTVVADEIYREYEPPEGEVT